MQGPTHRMGGVVSCFAGYVYLNKTGQTLNEVEPLVQLLIMYPFSIWGSTCSDLDHHPGKLSEQLNPLNEKAGNSLPSKDPVSRGISLILHATGRLHKLYPKNKLFGVLDSKHRSWQTHSELPLVLTILGLLAVTTYLPYIGSATAIILQLVLVGLMFGVIAHLILDLLTPEGLPFATGLLFNTLLGRKVLPSKIKIIPFIPPSKQGQPGFFSTGGTWERKIIYPLLFSASVFLLIYITITETPIGSELVGIMNDIPKG